MPSPESIAKARRGHENQPPDIAPGEPYTIIPGMEAYAADIDWLAEMYDGINRHSTPDYYDLLPAATAVAELVRLQTDMQDEALMRYHQRRIDMKIFETLQFTKEDPAHIYIELQRNIVPGATGLEDEEICILLGMYQYLGWRINVIGSRHTDTVGADLH